MHDKYDYKWLIHTRDKSRAFLRNYSCNRKSMAICLLKSRKKNKSANYFHNTNCETKEPTTNIIFITKAKWHASRLSRLAYYHSPSRCGSPDMIFFFVFPCWYFVYTESYPYRLSITRMQKKNINERAIKIFCRFTRRILTQSDAYAYTQ